MRIDDVEVGKAYRSKYYGKVTVEAIETTSEWAGWGSNRRKRTVRRLRALTENRASINLSARELDEPWEAWAVRQAEFKARRAVQDAKVEALDSALEAAGIEASTWFSTSRRNEDELAMTLSLGDAEKLIALLGDAVASRTPEGGGHLEP